jgi:hypothetical protein
MLDRVLRREHKKGTRQPVGFLFHGRGLRHRFQERGLGLGESAVDLIGEITLAKMGPDLNSNVLGPLIEDLNPTMSEEAYPMN